MWGRVPQFRIIYHPNDTIALGLSLENPEQYIGGSAGGSLITLPSGLASAYPELRWPETPDEAAKWLLKAWNDAEKVAESVQDQRLKELSTRFEKTDLQARVLRVTNKYDPKMAEKFIKQLAAKESGIRKDRAAFDDRNSRSEQLLRMAVQAVDTAPDLAFNLAVNSLADGISQSLQGVMTGLRAKKPELATRLYDLALARFSGRAPDPSEAEVLAGYLFYSGMTYTVDSAGRTIFTMNPSQQNYRRLPLLTHRGCAVFWSPHIKHSSHVRFRSRHRKAG